MGIFRDLVSNVANARMKEEQQKLAYNVGLGDILTTLIKNPETDDATFAKASAYYQDLMGKHGGKEGKAIQGQISQFLQAYGAQRATDRAKRTLGEKGTTPEQGEPSVPAGGMAPTPPLPAGQSPGQAGGVNYGWQTGQSTPATLAGTGTDGAQAGRQPAAQHGGLRGVLGGLAGVGKEMLGIPRDQGLMVPSKQQIADLYGPSVVGEAKEKERGVLAAEGLEREDYVRQQHANVASGLQTQADADENIREYDRARKPPSARSAAEEAQTLTTVEKKDGTIVPAWESRRGQGFKTLEGTAIDPKDIRSVGHPVDPKFTGRMAEREQIRRVLADPNSTPQQKADAKAEQDYMNTQAESAASLAQVRARQVETASSIVPGTDEFTIAQNLAYGDLTFDAFNRMIGYREPGRKEAVYVKAKQINPNFSQSAFEAGYRFYMRPQTRQQLASLDNVEAALTDMIRFSDNAKRSNLPAMNQFELPAGYMFGNREIANFNLALVAFSDELAGALGQGANTDMTRRMGREMSDGKVDPETFRTNLQIVAGFLDRKRNSLLGEMGPYGQPGGTTPVIHGRDEYDALPPGAPWRKPTDPEGTVRTKPRTNQ